MDMMKYAARTFAEMKNLAQNGLETMEGNVIPVNW